MEDTIDPRREVPTSGTLESIQGRQDNPQTGPTTPDVEEPGQSQRIPQRRETLRDLTHYIYLAFIPGLEFAKVFGTLFCGCNSIFRTWIGPSIYQAPWSQWLHYPGLPPILGAPYSIFWYWFYRLIAWDPLFANLVLITIDLAFLLVIWKKHGFAWAVVYQFYGMMFLLMFPSDMLILWLTILAYRWRPFLVIAPLVKLPIGAPLWVWQWIWSSPYSLHNPENTVRYSLLAIAWTGALLWQSRYRLNSLIFRLIDRFH